MRNNHAVFHRTHVRAWLVAVALGCVSLSTLAGFVTPAPPAGMSGGTFTPSAPTALQGLLEKAPYARIPGPALAGAGETGAAVRLGGGAARVLAGRVVGGLVPAVGVALGVAWLAQNCFEQRNGQWVRTCGPGTDQAPEVPSPGQMFRVGGQIVGPWSDTRSGACQLASGAFNTFVRGLGYSEGNLSWESGLQCKSAWRASGGAWQYGTQSITTGTCATGWYVTTGGCVQSPSFTPVPVTPQEVEDGMANKPLPPVVPQGVPYPLDPSSPYIFNPDANNPPNAQPLRVPQGLPRPVPNTNPQQYQQPVTRYVPAPTVAEPTRLDAQPENVTGTSPTGITSPTTPPPSSTDGKEPDKFDLCKEHPDVLACQKVELDTPDGQIPKETRDVSFTPENVGGGGSCPADSFVHLTSTGQTLKAWDWTATCNYFLPIRAIVMTLAAFSALLIVLPGSGRPA